MYPSTTLTDLLEMIRSGENSGVEFKRDEITNDQMARELVAFSNLEGGSLLLGVEDDGNVSGITRPNIEEWVMTACRDKIRPSIIPFFEIVRSVAPARDVAIVRVARGYTVQSVWHNARNWYYIRVGSQSREPSQELGRLFQQRGAFRAELRPVSGASIDDLDFRRLRDYFRRVRRQDGVPDDRDRAAWQILLYNTEILVDEGVSLAGMLLFGNTPNRFLPQAGISGVAFPGMVKDYAAHERVALRGPMVSLMDDRGELLEAGLVEQAVGFIRRNTGAKAIMRDGLRREDVPVYPIEVLRESVVNALIHRDYLLAATDIEISIFEDRMEIVSPGRLPNGITITRMRTGCRAARNQLIKDVMGDYGYVEDIGLGVPRKIIAGMREHNGTDPVLLEDEESLTLRLLAG